MIATIPLNIEALAQRIVTATLNLEEAANSCAINPDLANFDEMMVCMRTMHETLRIAFGEVSDE